MNLLALHFSMLDGDDDKAEEDLVRTLLGVIGYSRQSLRLHPDGWKWIDKHMCSEYLRVMAKL